LSCHPILRLAVFAGLSFLATAGQARAGYVASLGLQGSAAAMAGDDAPWSDAAAEAGAAPACPEDEAGSPHRLKANDPFACLNPYTAFFGPSSPAQDGGGMGSSGSSSSGGAGQHFGLSSSLPSLDVELVGRLFLVYVYHLPPPFPARLFHPPRAPAA
jgi:hypothetical protein